MKKNSVTASFIGIAAVFLTLGFLGGKYINEQGVSGTDEPVNGILLFGMAFELPSDCYLFAYQSVFKESYVRYKCNLAGQRYEIILQDSHADSLVHLEDIPHLLESFQWGALNGKKVQLENARYPFYQICDAKLCMLVQPALPEIMDQVVAQLKKTKKQE